MNLENRLTDVLRDIHSAMQAGSAMPSKDIIPLIDLTLLDTHATPYDINALAMKANHHQVAAICVLSEHLNYVSPDIHVKRATVANFPSGAMPHQRVLKTITQTATHCHVDEIDYVFPYQAYLSGNQVTALSNCHEIYTLCKQHKLTFKVILETGALPSIDMIYNLSTAIIDNGCDFLKTSTGKIPTGATIPAVFAMLAAQVDSDIPCGIKVSGGIKTTEQALSYMRLAQYMFNCTLDSSRFRLGASSLLDDILITNTQHHRVF